MSKKKLKKLPSSFDCMLIITRVVGEFPGLIDYETEVNGGDLVDYLTQQIAAFLPNPEST